MIIFLNLTLNLKILLKINKQKLVCLESSFPTWLISPVLTAGDGCTALVLSLNDSFELLRVSGV